MAEPTLAEKIIAAEKALEDRGVKDADEAERAVAVFVALDALRPDTTVDPEMIRKIVKEEIAALVPPEPAPTEPPVLVTSLLNSNDPVIQARIKALGDEATAIMKLLAGAPVGSP